MLALLTGCATAASETPTPEPTVIPASIPTDTPTPTVTPLPFVEANKFPTGTFESASGVVAVEFREDGTCRWYSQRYVATDKGGPEVEGWEVPCKYGVNGNLFSEMTFQYPTGRQVPATYYWTFDGKNLTFQLWGEDLRPHRKFNYDGQTYLFSGETDVSSKVEGIEFPIGRFLLESPSFYALEFDEDGTWRGYLSDGDVPIISGKYATNGNLWTEMTHDYPTSPKVPATYFWTYDGKNLTFQLWGEDVNPSRKIYLDGQTYIKAE